MWFQAAFDIYRRMLFNPRYRDAGKKASFPKGHPLSFLNGSNVRVNQTNTETLIEMTPSQVEQFVELNKKRLAREAIE